MTEVGELATETCYVPNLNDLEELDKALSLYSPGFLLTDSNSQMMHNLNPARVQFLNLKSVYEKCQQRRKTSGLEEFSPTEKPRKCCNSEQRLKDAWVDVVLDYCGILEGLYVYVERVPEAARKMKNIVGRIPLPIEMTGEKTFSVNLDSVYETDNKEKVYKLAKVKMDELNLFRIIVVMVFQDRNFREFFSSSFLVRSMKKSPDLSPTSTPERHHESFSSDEEYSLSGPRLGKRARLNSEGLYSANSPISDSGVSTTSSSYTYSIPEVITNNLVAQSATIDELRLMKPIQTSQGDIAYHFKLTKSMVHQELEEGDVIGFFEDEKGRTVIALLTQKNAGRAKLQGVISRSAYLEGSKPLYDKDDVSDLVCVMGMVRVKVLGPIINGERVYASLDHPGLAVTKNRLLSQTSYDMTLLGQALESSCVGPNDVTLVPCFVSVLLSINSKHVNTVAMEIKDDVRGNVKEEFKEQKRKCWQGLRRQFAVLLILALLIAIMLWQMFAPQTAFRYWQCGEGALEDSTMSFTFETEDHQWPRVNGVEFEFSELKEKLSLDIGPMNRTDMHYYLNIDRCAAGGIRLVSSPLDGLPMVRGAEVFAVNDNCTEAYWHGETWSIYKTGKDMVCSSHGYMVK